jgi:hypothetical protein
MTRCFRKVDRRPARSSICARTKLSHAITCIKHRELGETPDSGTFLSVRLSLSRNVTTAMAVPSWYTQFPSFQAFR